MSANQTVPQEVLQWFSRTIAVLVLIGFSGWLGSLLDDWFDTNFLVVLGFVLGTVAGLTGFIVILQREDLRRRGLRNESADPVKELDRGRSSQPTDADSK